MKIFRWWGVLVFPVIIVLVILVYVLFAERLIKHIIEQTGTAMVGAEVNLDKVELDWSRGKIQLQHLQVTNADAPLRNLIEIQSIVADIDPAQVLWRRAHLDQMAIHGMTFNTPRTHSGAIAKDDTEGTGVMDFLPQLTALDWNALGDQSGWAALFDNLQLDSLKSVDALRGELKNAEQDLKAKIEALPNHEALKQYEERVKTLTAKLDGDKLSRAMQLLERGKQLDKLRKELKAEIEKVKAVEAQYKASKAQLQAQYVRVKQAPEKDIEKVLSQLSVELPGTDQLLSRVLGPELNARLQQGNALYQEASPWIEKARIVAGKDPNAPPPPARFKGIDVHFVERDPQPSFWLKTAAIDGAVDALGNTFTFDGQLRNVSNDANAIAEPVTLNLDGKAAQGGAAHIAVVIDNRRASAHQNVQFRLHDVPLSAIPISADKQFELHIANARLSASLEGEFKTGDAQLRGNANITQMQLTTASDSSHKFIQAILAELAHVDAFDVQFNWASHGDKETRELSSSLDDIAKRAVNNVVRNELNAKKAEAKAKLKERANAELAKLDVDWTSLGALEPLLGDKLKRLNEMVDKAKKN